MALSSNQYRNMNAELERIQTRLMELAIEIDAAAPMHDKQGLTYQFAQQVGEAVAYLRTMLQQEQAESIAMKKVLSGVTSSPNSIVSLR